MLPTASCDEDNQIYEDDLLRFFAALSEQVPHIYALLAGAPKTVFWIVKDDEDAYPDEKTFSTGEFRAHVGQFAAEDSFRVYFHVYFFREERDECVPYRDSMDNPFNGEDKFEITDKKELTVATLESEWRHMLAYLCREAILSNNPFRFDDPIRRFGFTAQDIAALQEPVARCNERVIAELREQYDRLAAIGCLHRTEQ